MMKIAITQFKGYTKDMFLDYFRCHGTPFTKITIPKDYGDDPAVLEQEYFRALYTGQLLGCLSEAVLHSIPDPAVPGEFAFLIATTQWEELAGLLVYLCNGFDFDDHFDDFVDFDQAAFSFLEDLDEGEEIRCPYFLDVIEQYSK